MYLSLLNFNIVMKHLKLQDHQAKKRNYRKGLAYLKKPGNHKPKPNIAFAKNEKKNTLKQIITGDHPTKKKRKEEWRTIESTGTRGSNGNK